MILGQTISDWRAKRRISIRRLAKIIGVDYAAIHRLEHGKDIRITTLARILNWLLLG